MNEVLREQRQREYDRALFEVHLSGMRAAILLKTLLAGGYIPQHHANHVSEIVNEFDKTNATYTQALNGRIAGDRPFAVGERVEWADHYAEWAGLKEPVAGRVCEITRDGINANVYWDDGKSSVGVHHSNLKRAA